jgi:hypothetical protein
VLAKPLTNLLHKGVLFVWTDETERAFQLLKEALITAPVLSLPDFTKVFTVETDASDIGICAILLQDNHPIAFVSKSLGPKTRGLSTYKKEFLAILLAIDQWRPYLQHAEFRILTDQRSLAHLSDQHLHTPWQHKALTKILGLQYTIVYRKGSENIAADALSCRPQALGTLAAILSVQATWLQEIIEGYQTDTATQAKLTQLAINVASGGDFTLRDGLLRHRGPIGWVTVSRFRHESEQLCMIVLQVTILVFQ